MKVKFNNHAEKSDLIKILNYARGLYRKTSLFVEAKTTSKFDELLIECKNSIEKSSDVYNSILNLVSYLKPLIIAKTASVSLNDNNDNEKKSSNGLTSPAVASNERKTKKAVLIDASDENGTKGEESTPKKQRISSPERSPSKATTNMDVDESNQAKTETEEKHLLVDISKKEEIALNNIIKLDKLLEVKK